MAVDSACKSPPVGPTWDAAAGRALAYALAMTLLSACVRQPPYNPFKTSAVEVRERIRTIAIAPLVAAASLTDRESARTRIEAIATERLRAGDFEVVPSEEMDRYWRRAADDVGGVYDPVTGEVDEARFDAVRTAVYRDLGSERGADAVLYLRITPVVLYLPGTAVTYCGTTTQEPVYWPASEPSPDPPTLAVVLCLNAALFDLEGRELYGIRHGLETVETYAQQTRAVRPVAERLQNPSRLRRAVEATLGPLAGAGRTPD